MNSLLMVALFFSGSLLAAESGTFFRVDPHAYGGRRGTEPDQQVIGLAKLAHATPNSFLAFHLESEVMGRRDVSLDVDRAWMRFPLSETTRGLALVLGRTHPWDLSGHPDVHRPFGYLGSGQPQNRGLQLGYGYGDSNVPQPILLGYLGAHLWSGENESPWQFCISVSPFFVPTLGSEVSFSHREAASVGRFARRPPGTVTVNGVQHPIYFDVDKTNLVSDVLLQPQALALGVYRSGAWGSYLSLFRAPTSEPEYDSTDYLRVEDDSVSAVAIVRPKFPQRFGASLRQDYAFLTSWKVFASLQMTEDGRGGWEMGLDHPFFSLSYADELASAQSNVRFKTTEAKFIDRLLQAQGRLPWGALTAYTGVMTHLSSRDLWYRLGFSVEASRDLRFDLAGDLFAGEAGSYFGEWRTNDRVSLVMTWKFDR